MTQSCGPRCRTPELPIAGKQAELIGRRFIVTQDYAPFTRQNFIGARVAARRAGSRCAFGECNIERVTALAQGTAVPTAPGFSGRLKLKIARVPLCP